MLSLTAIICRLRFLFPSEGEKKAFWWSKPSRKRGEKTQRWKMWCDSVVHIPWGKYRSTYVYTWLYKLSFVPILVAHCMGSFTKPFPQHWKQNVRLNFFGGSGEHSWMGWVLHFAFKKSLFRSFYGWKNNKVDSKF